MTPSARLQATLDLLTEISITPRPADAITSAYFRARRYIGSHDRGAISKMLYGILRHHARLGWWLHQKAETEPSSREHLLAYMALVLKTSPDQIASMCSGGKYGPPPLDENERKFLRKIATRSIDHPNMPEEVKGECPDWAAPQLKARFGENFLPEMKALLEPAPLDLRVNILKTDRATMIQELKDLGYRATAGKLSPYCIRIDERPSLATLPLLKKGFIEIQDEGSQLIALLVGARPGHRVVDFCAGAGGKTLAVAAEMKNKGKIIACDVLEMRLKKSTERFRRAGLHNVEIKPLSSEVDPWVKRHKSSFDRVLVDAPCTGTGTWRRNPDSRWHILGPTLETLLPLQQRILTSAARLVKPGGRLIYATCSLLPEENERQIEAFLAVQHDFVLVPFGSVLQEPVTSAHHDYMSLTPGQNRTDGFFAAVLERAPKVPQEASEESMDDDHAEDEDGSP